MKLSFFFSKLIHRLWSTQSVLLLTRPAGAYDHATEVNSFSGELRSVSKQELCDCAAFEDYEHYAPIYKAMLNKGDQIQFGYINGSCVYKQCVQFNGQVHHEGFSVLTLGEKEAYLHYMFCAPQARKRGFQTSGIRQLIRGYPDYTFCALVASDNEASLRNFYKTGFTPSRLITVRCRLLHRALIEKQITGK